MINIFGICFHCWHHIDGTRRKIKSNSRCKEAHPYISETHVKYIMQKRCCKCGAVKQTTIYRDYDVMRGLSYPPLEE